MNGVIDMAPMEVETIEIILEQQKEQLNKHDDRIKSLELEFAKTNISLEYLKESHDELKQSMKSLENTVVQNNNVTLTSLNQLNSYLITKENNQTQIDLARENNSTEKQINKYTNIKELIVQILITGSTVFGAIYASNQLIK